MAFFPSNIIFACPLIVSIPT